MPCHNDTLFMELRLRASSGTISSSIQTLYFLSAKIQVYRSSSENDIKLTVRASSLVAFNVAKMGLDKTESFYRGMVLWAAGREEKREARAARAG